jgi:DNA invertase Pin-like site-specific DNA recombinase
MKVALYARVSTDDQETAGQLERLRLYVKAMGWEIVGEWVDKGESGATDDRPAYNSMLKARGYEAILITKLDRVMRSLIHLEKLVLALDKRKVSLIAIDEGIDTGAEGDDDSKRLVRQILGSVAEWERKRIVSRTKEGQARARKYGTRSGKPIGRPRLPDDKISRAGMRKRALRAAGTKRPVDSLNINVPKNGPKQNVSFVSTEGLDHDS